MDRWNCIDKKSHVSFAQCSLLERQSVKSLKTRISCNSVTGLQFSADSCLIKQRNTGRKFLKKMWCCVGGSITR